MLEWVLEWVLQLEWVFRMGVRMGVLLAFHPHRGVLRGARGDVVDACLDLDADLCVLGRPLGPARVRVVGHEARAVPADVDRALQLLEVVAGVVAAPRLCWVIIIIYNFISSTNISNILRYL